MPEGDTVHKVSTVLREALVGKTPVGLELRPYLASQLPVGLPITAIEAIGKHCLITFGDKVCLRIHLGMHGGWNRVPRPWQRKGEILAVIETETEAFICLRAKDVELFPVADRKRHPVLTRLGPDLLAPDIDWDVVLERARRLSVADRPIADVFGDQKVACGFGNVYRNELCFLGQPVSPKFFQPGRGFAPAFPISEIPDEVLLGVYQRGREALFANLGGWPRTLVVDARRTPLGPGSPRTWVYGRTRLPCWICGTPIRSLAQGDEARSTQWCPRCQPVGELGPERAEPRLKMRTRNRR
jgi:endonuclease-8